ncbi:MAG: hypothetical protein PWQ25_403 [Deferribacteres bacterium]|nr:hypothetical protein [Deferribacteres bacterium]
MGMILKSAITIFVIYCLVMVGLPWGKFAIYKSAAERIMMNNDRLPADRVVKSLIEEADSLKIPVRKENIKFIRNYEDTITTVVEYKETVNYPFLRKPIVFNYKIEKERPLKGDEGGN